MNNFFKLFVIENKHWLHLINTQNPFLVPRFRITSESMVIIQKQDKYIKKKTSYYLTFSYI